jgi:large subunit ribosomal protein L13
MKKQLTESTRPQKQTNIVRDWHLVDLDKQILGRATTKISTLLQGKHKTNYVPYLDMGDYVVAINATKVKLSGNKQQNKVYSRYSGYPGGQKTKTFTEVIKKNPAEVIRHAVSGMLPKNKLRARRLARLYVFEGGDHPYKSKFNQ